MNKIYLLFSLLAISCAGSHVSTEKGEDYLVFQNIHIVDVEAGVLRPGQTVVIKDSLLHFIGDSWPDKALSNLKIIDGSGKFLLPGLWDMHFHLCWEESNDSLLSPLLLSYGITGLRDMGGDLTIQNQFKQTIAAHPEKGPEIIGAGPILDGNPPLMYDFSIALDSQIQVVSLLDSLITAGADFFKTYSLIREAELTQIAEYADQHDLSFAGHLSEYIEPERSIALRQKSIEHLNRLDDIWQSDPERLAQIGQLMLEQKTWLCPTLLVYHLKVHHRDAAIVKPELDSYIHPILQQEWQQSRARRLSRYDSLDWENQLLLFEQQKQLLAYLFKEGVPLLAGSDFGGMPYAYPGLGLHQELALLVEVGLSPANALATATINPAKYFSQETHYGSIQEGKYADLLLLSKNPLDNIENTQAIEQVYRKGKRVH